MESPPSYASVKDRAKALPWKPITLGLLFLVLFHSQVRYLVFDVWTQEKYSHGFFVPLVSLAYLWIHRKRISESRGRPAIAGVFIVAAGILGWLWVQRVSFNALAHMSMMLVIVGMVVFAAGWRYLKAAAFPVFFLLFAFPVPKRLDTLYIVLPLQRLASTIAEHVMDFVGIPVWREGNVIQLPNLSLLVEEACSGIHSLYSLIALGTAYVFFTERTTWERWILIASTVPIAILSNVIRVTMTGILAYTVTKEFAQGFLHEFSGMVVFLLGLALFLLEAYLLRVLRTLGSPSRPQ